MFESLSTKINATFRKLAGKSKLTEANINDAMREVRIALLDADVALDVVKKFIAKVKSNALGKVVTAGVNPDQFFIKIVNDELKTILGSSNQELDLKSSPPAIILLAGLQGSGKTTSAAKLAKFITKKYNKSVATVSCDIYRPAAIDQLRSVSGLVGANFIESNPSQSPRDILKHAVELSKRNQYEVLIVDTAGRTQIDQNLMQEIKELHSFAKPVETLFVVDSMIGQEAAHIAKSFNDTINITGIILTKVDGDSRGGAALSITSITGKPIKFLADGENLDALALFHPDRIASRILGMGDILSFVEQIENKVNKEQSEKMAKKLMSGQKFDLNDFRDQFQQMRDIGGMQKMMSHLPGMTNIGQVTKASITGAEKKFNQMVVIIDSMTKQERSYPQIINGSRKRRIANGSGTSIADVNKLLKQFEQMQKMFKKFGGKGKLAALAKSMQAGSNLPF